MLSRNLLSTALLVFPKYYASAVLVVLDFNKKDVTLLKPIKIMLIFSALFVKEFWLIKKLQLKV